MTEPTHPYLVRDAAGVDYVYKTADAAISSLTMARRATGSGGIYTKGPDGNLRLLAYEGPWPATRGGDVPRNTERASATTSNELGRK